MCYQHIYYSKHDIGFTRYYKYSYLTTTFKYKGKMNIMKVRACEKAKF